ncbi:MAG: metallophosphoesterase [Lentisphaeria bacterium]
MDMLTFLAAGILAVNLGPVANRSYTDTPQTRGWIENENHLSLGRIPDGRQQYGDIPFRVTNSRTAGGKDFLYLAGKHWNRMPAAAALPLHTGKAYAQLHLLHAAGWVAPGQPLGELIVSYADGTQQEIPIQAGRDVADWYNGREGDNARFAYAEGANKNLGNYVSSFALAAKPPVQLQFRVTDEKGMWMISAVTLSEKPLALPPRSHVPALTPRQTPLPVAKREGPSYQVLVLGDTHFDADPAVYHRDYHEPDSRLNHIQRAEFARNAEMWSGYGPRLLRAVGRQVTADTAFVLQLGDLVQGDCGNPQVHSRMLLDALQLCQKAFPGLPFLTTAGNHDIRGTGAAAAYRDTLLPYLSRELKQPVRSLNFCFSHGPDLFLFIDFNDPDPEVIRRALAEHGGARYKFVVTHGPVIPSDNHAAAWFLFGGADRTRAEMRELFLKNDVIVLAGHTHTLELAECATDAGRITQLIANSVWMNEPLAKPAVQFEHPADYGRRQREEYQNLEGARLLDEYRPALTRYFLAEGAGYVRLDITPDGVTAVFFGGDRPAPALTFRLR